MDISLGNLRFLRHHGIPLLRASAFSLPFRDKSFDCLISSQVIEHIPYADDLFAEMNRVLRPGGMLVIGTPDYATIGWRAIGPLFGFLMPGGYRDEHVTDYTRQSLTEILARYGISHEESAYVARSERIMRMRKKEAGRVGASTPPKAARSNLAA